MTKKDGMGNRGYLTLRELQAVTLELLQDFDSFCKGEGIEYSLCGGSMLGAARHEGFIPWDDDIDVMMLRSDYEKLLTRAPRASRKAGRALISLRDRTFARGYARYVRTDYGKEEEGVTAKDCPWVGIDIFPIDFIADDDESFSRQLRDYRFWNELVLTCASPFNTGSSFVKRWARNLVRPFAFAYGRFRAAEKCEEVCVRFDGVQRKSIAIVCGMYGLRERWSFDDYSPLVEVSFEGCSFPAPHGYDAYLTAVYGDYLVMPPEDKRKPSHIRAWKL